MVVEFVGTRDIAPGELTRFPGNARTGDLDAIRESVRRNGQYRAVVVRDTGTGLVILAGNHTADAAQAEGHPTVRCDVVTCSDEDATRINLGDNRLAELGDYDNAELLTQLASLDEDLDATGYNLDDLD